MKHYLAIDLGATSGRHIVGTLDNGTFSLQEVYRFPNGVRVSGGSLVWDTERLFAEVLNGICAAFARFPKIESLSVDSWGVDYVLMDGKKERIPCYSYRDSRTEDVVEKVHAAVPFELLYARTGIQYMRFNTVYQLYDDLQKGRLAGATDFLMIPEYLHYRLTGVKKKEYTNSTTTGLVNAATGAFDDNIISALGLPKSLFGDLNAPGELVGRLLPEIAAAVGGQTKVTLCASHDTASAFEAAEAGRDAVILSSGTWSLLGIKKEKPDTSERSRRYNFTNEGGPGYIRYLKNISGLWLLSKLREEYALGAAEAETLAKTSGYREIFDINDGAFVAPQKMSMAIAKYMTERALPAPQTAADYLNSAYLSLAEGYRRAIAELEEATGRAYSELYIMGGGAKDGYLNTLASEATGKKVVAAPIEATALGNLKIQAAYNR